MNGDGPNIAALLRRSEGDTLDFKQDNYLFPHGTDEEKSELLKDILALANAWKDADGHIVIGIVENHGRATSTRGVTPSLKDSDVQQFVNSKANRPVVFGIEHVSFEDRTLTIIQVKQTQSRPIFLRKNYGRLKANVVYVRHGSSTDEASPDQISEMAREDFFATQVPDIALSFEISLETWYYELPYRERSLEVDLLAVIATNQGAALANHVQGSVTLPCDILYGGTNTPELPTRKIEFSNKLSDSSPNYLHASRADWKPLSPGMRLRLLQERVLPFREEFKKMGASIHWELAVDSCKFKVGETKFCDLLIVDHRRSESASR